MVVIEAYAVLRAWLKSEESNVMPDAVGDALSVILEYAASEHERLKARIAELERRGD